MASSKEGLARWYRKLRKQITEPLEDVIHDMVINVFAYVIHPLYKNILPSNWSIFILSASLEAL